jgi:enamine deaminase RidA (YjgF/YER057c/UK114 family)
MLELVNPRELVEPRGYSHGAKATGRFLFVAGQIGWKADGTMAGSDFIGQFDQALGNVLAVVAAAGGEAASIAKLTIFVTDKSLYQAGLKEVGERYRARMGRHYPAMTLVEVRSLLEPAALVEIDAVAVL